ncbi:MAG: hypothetical protein PVG60_06720 [Desulfarculaceae bacterium]|jgi:hypothetical protein
MRFNRVCLLLLSTALSVSLCGSPAWAGFFNDLGNAFKQAADEVGEHTKDGAGQLSDDAKKLKKGAEEDKSRYDRGEKMKPRPDNEPETDKSN